MEVTTGGVVRRLCLAGSSGAAEERWFSGGCQPSGAEPMGLDQAQPLGLPSGAGSGSFPTSLKDLWLYLRVLWLSLQLWDPC